MKPIADRLSEVYRRATMNNAQAYNWLVAAHSWMHHIDDIVDGDMDVEAVPFIGSQAVALMSDPFFVRNSTALAPVLMSIAIQYQASLKAPREVVDMLRLSGNQLVLWVANLMGGYAHAQAVAEDLWPIVIESQIAPPAPAQPT